MRRSTPFLELHKKAAAVLTLSEALFPDSYSLTIVARHEDLTTAHIFISKDSIEDVEKTLLELRMSREGSDSKQGAEWNRILND